jgi:putative aldouronate transport system permease protein
MPHAFLRKNREDHVMDSVIAIVMAIVLIACFYPFFLAVVYSFNEGLDASRGGIYLWPRKPTLSNYAAFFRDDKWLRGFLVSIARTGAGTLITTGFTTLIAYALSFRSLMFRKSYLGLVILCMYFSGGMIPTYVTYRALGLINTFWVYVIPSALNLFYVIVAISFFQEIPAELHESARLDGAGELRTLWSIVMPVSLPLLATVAIFTAVNHWSAWFDSAFYVQSSKLRTMGYLLMEIINVQTNSSNSMRDAAVSAVKTTPLSIQVAAMVIAVFPIMVVYPFLQKYFITGLTLGSVKG